MRKLSMLPFVMLIAACASGGAKIPASSKTQEAPPAQTTVAVAVAEKASIINSSDMEFVLIKGGCYKMGSALGNADEKPVHDVCIGDFYLGKYEVTQKQWERTMGTNPSTIKECGLDCPVNAVSWEDSQEFIKKLNTASGKQYRLPTEAEWEYAARSGGRQEKFAGTNDDASIAQYGWYDENSNMKGQRVGQLRANGLGLYDMTGNVQEWCQDWYNETYYGVSTKENPSGPASGQNKIMRGGSWNEEINDMRTTIRRNAEISRRALTYGLRLAAPAK